MAGASDVSSIMAELEKEKSERSRLTERLANMKEDLKKMSQDKETVGCFYNIIHLFIGNNCGCRISWP